jgi:hypothetical protein
MEIKLAKGTLRVAGNVDVVVLRTAIRLKNVAGSAPRAAGHCSNH